MLCQLCLMFVSVKILSFPRLITCPRLRGGQACVGPFLACLDGFVPESTLVGNPLPVRVVAFGWLLMQAQADLRVVFR